MTIWPFWVQAERQPSMGARVAQLFGLLLVSLVLTKMLGLW